MNICIRVRTVPADVREALQGIAEVSQDPEGGLTLFIAEDDSSVQGAETKKLRRLLDLLDNSGIPLTAIETRKATLEKLFLQLTGRSLRD